MLACPAVERSALACFRLRRCVRGRSPPPALPWGSASLGPWATRLAGGVAVLKDLSLAPCFGLELDASALRRVGFQLTRSRPPMEFEGRRCRDEGRRCRGGGPRCNDEGRRCRGRRTQLCCVSGCANFARCVWLMVVRTHHWCRTRRNARCV